MTISNPGQQRMISVKMLKQLGAELPENIPDCAVVFYDKISVKPVGISKEGDMEVALTFDYASAKWVQFDFEINQDGSMTPL